MDTGFAIALAWPETKCKQAGAWYDSLMQTMGFNDNGYYTVGHAAVILISDTGKDCEYFDFGRYHAPYNYGRVRDRITDHDLAIQTQPVISADGQQIKNLKEILAELYHNPSCHGDGTIYAACLRINFEKSFHQAKALQEKEFLKYGPFVRPGTNCSRFVSRVVFKGVGSLLMKMKLMFQPTLTPTPFGNLRAITSSMVSYSSRDRIARPAAKTLQLQDQP